MVRSAIRDKRPGQDTQEICLQWASIVRIASWVLTSTTTGPGNANGAERLGTDSRYMLMCESGSRERERAQAHGGKWNLALSLVERSGWLVGSTWYLGVKEEISYDYNFQANAGRETKIVSI